ncbi:MAG: ABC transporter ATP-binding protein/permease [Planktomarina sp.]|jgi:ABC-type transport system involved in Fe-S cluster assembly fused permease/ATPase subunit|nr:ABC transporter ATP-binding protein/permease [Planktomarina sp.]MDS9949574.1 ABC transporter ATP-binding protein/permease [Planktomarina sp.]|tara:strand:- start:16128 stop:17963 length:1836 start_codon:yes stop_codon:yes gene_type:complete
MKSIDHPENQHDRKVEIRVIARVLPYLWPKGQAWVKWRVIIALVSLVMAKLVAVATPMIMGAAVDNLSGDGGPSQILMLGAIGLTVAYGLSRILESAFQQLRDIVFAKVGQRALRKVGLETFQHIHNMSLRYHLSRQTGGLSRVMERGVKGVSFLLRFLLFSIGPLALQLILISIALATLFNVRYLGVIALAVVAYVLFTAVVTEWRVKIRKVMNDQDKDANQKAIDSLLNFETVKYFGAEMREAGRYDAAMEGYEAAAIKTSYSLGFINIGQSLIINTAMVAVMIMSAQDVAAGRASVGGFVAVNAYIMQVMMPLNFLGFVYREIRQALVDMSEMFSLLERPPEVEDKDAATALEVTGGCIEFRDIQFSYDAERPILKGVSLKVEPGQTWAIVGPSGSGKSTLGRLLFRFYDVNDGALLIDDQDIRDITQRSLHEAIGVVPQDTVLFNDTIYYNIAYGRTGATPDQVKTAAKAAQIHDFVESLPMGYETTVGERGLKLSGGEKQRVGIARTLLKDPPILLLDEATSALDSETEYDIQDSLIQMGRGRTVLTIAHRLSTVVHADRIVVLEKGQIVEQGRHDELMLKAGRYAHLWNLQLAENGKASRHKELV